VTDDQCAVDKVLGLLQRVRRSGKGWVACCPAHDDRHASLSVGVGDDGRALLHCFAGCDVQTIVAALGLQMSDLFSDTRTTPPATGATVQHQPANPDRSADSAVAWANSEPTVAPLQPDQEGLRAHAVVGCTLEAYAHAKRLPVDFLRSLGLSDFHVRGCTSRPDAVCGQGRPRAGCPLPDRRRRRRQVSLEAALEGVPIRADTREEGARAGLRGAG
jgi:CHC2 zinc finger